MATLSCFPIASSDLFGPAGGPSEDEPVRPSQLAAVVVEGDHDGGVARCVDEPAERPPGPRARRHMLGVVLAVAVAAVPASARSLAAIGEWAADAPGPVLAALGCAATR